MLDQRNQIVPFFYIRYFSGRHIQNGTDLVLPDHFFQFGRVNAAGIGQYIRCSLVDHIHRELHHLAGFFFQGH
ncbi:MAG: hypothetical protein KDA33_03610, partial [Phycisphaerales bacterium]|nr:hypothetical protein [Phycisphaerales bacterium]